MNTVDFSLPDQNGNIHTLSQYKGKWVILYFYPKDDTPGCIKEACGFRDISKVLAGKNAVILGVSKDSVATHRKFADKYHLNFPILSDDQRKVIRAYDAWGKKNFLGRIIEGTLRRSYLIGPEGNIRKAYPRVNPLIHAQELLEDLSKFSK